MVEKSFRLSRMEKNSENVKSEPIDFQWNTREKKKHKSLIEQDIVYYREIEIYPPIMI